MFATRPLRWANIWVTTPWKSAGTPMLRRSTRGVFRVRHNRCVPSHASQLSSWLGNTGPPDSALWSPKLEASTGKTAGWYRYYAGYADTFVADVVRRLPEPAGMVLDPWNGSGT